MHTPVWSKTEGESGGEKDRAQAEGVRKQRGSEAEPRRETERKTEKERGVGGWAGLGERKGTGEGRGVAEREKGHGLPFGVMEMSGIRPW